MTGIHAGRRIAAMADDQSILDRAEGQFPRHAMRHRADLLPVHAALGDEAIATAARGAGPQPTVGGFIDFGPEAFYKRRALRTPVRIARVIAELQAIFVGLEGVAAGGAEDSARPSPNLIQSLIQMRYLNIHYQTLRICKAIYLISQNTHTLIAQFLTHAAPITISNGTPVVLLISMPTFGRGQIFCSSRRAYFDWDTPKKLAASRWLQPRARRQFLSDA